LFERNRHFDKTSPEAKIGCFPPNARTVALGMEFDRIG
jgi:hypothetical protein